MLISYPITFYIRGKGINVGEICHNIFQMFLDRFCCVSPSRDSWSGFKYVKCGIDFILSTPSSAHIDGKTGWRDYWMNIRWFQCNHADFRVIDLGFVLFLWHHWLEIIGVWAPNYPSPIYRHLVLFSLAHWPSRTRGCSRKRARGRMRGQNSMDYSEWAGMTPHCSSLRTIDN